MAENISNNPQLIEALGYRRNVLSKYRPCAILC